MRSILTLLCLLLSLTVFAQSCQQQQVSLQVLGSGGPELDDGRVSSAHLIRINGQARVMVDAGSGSAHQLEQLGVDINQLEAVLLTHLHVDHSMDLPALIKGFYFTRRDTDLAVLGPAGNQRMPDTTVFIERLFGPDGAFRYLKGYLNPAGSSSYNIRAFDAPLNQQTIHHHQLNEQLSFNSIAVNHGPISAVAWQVRIGDCSITFSGDMSNAYHSLEKLAAGTDLLVANNVIEEGSTGVGRQLHMPPSEIAEIAARAKPGKLLLAHFMKRSLPHREQAVELIGKRYPGPVLLAEDGMIIEL
jgi:ribonuclease BN (tRNA processing enzyme)